MISQEERNLEELANREDSSYKKLGTTKAMNQPLGNEGTSATDVIGAVGTGAVGVGTAAQLMRRKAAGWRPSSFAKSEPVIPATATCRRIVPINHFPYGEPNK